jgi:hypothetical protein
MTQITAMMKNAMFSLKRLDSVLGEIGRYIAL